VHEDVSVFTERILKSVASALQNFHKTLHIVFDKCSGNIQTQRRCKYSQSLKTYKLSKNSHRMVVNAL